MKSISGSGTSIQSAARAARVLLCVAANAETGARAKDVSDALSLSVPTTHHLLNTLVAEGLVFKDARRRYFLGPKVGVLADAFQRQEAVPEHLLGALHKLARTTGETAYLTAWRRDEIRVLASVEGMQAVRVSGLHSGYYENGHARATGKLLLAFARPDVRRAYLEANPLAPVTPRTITDPKAFEQELERIRERGYAFDEEEFHEGVACVSAPVLEHGAVLAALTISAPVGRFEARRESLTDAVVHVARSVPSLAGQSADELIA